MSEVPENISITAKTYEGETVTGKPYLHVLTVESDADWLDFSVEAVGGGVVVFRVDLTREQVDVLKRIVPGLET